MRNVVFALIHQIGRLDIRLQFPHIAECFDDTTIVGDAFMAEAPIDLCVCKNLCEFHCKLRNSLALPSLIYSI